MEFPIELGDNPCAKGAPITIGWEPQDQRMFELDEYEKKKPAPRSKHEMHIPASIRESLLQSQGATMKQIRQATRESQKINQLRQQSVQNRKWDGVNMALESASRKLKKVATKPFSRRNPKFTFSPSESPRTSFTESIPPAVVEGLHTDEVDDDDDEEEEEDPLSF